MSQLPPAKPKLLYFETAREYATLYNNFLSRKTTEFFAPLLSYLQLLFQLQATLMNAIPLQLQVTLSNAISLQLHATLSYS